MVGFGVLLVILGIGSLLLPMFDIQFRIMALLDDYQPIAGVAIAAVGAALVFVGLRNRPTKQVTRTTEAPAIQEPPAAT